MLRITPFLCAALTAAAFAAPAAAQAYPSRAITVIVPFAPGGTSDTLGRLVATSLSKQLGQTVVVENSGGAGGLIGMQKLQKSAPDGYTLAFNNMSLAILPHLHPKANYDPQKELAPIGIVATVPMVLSVSNKSGIQDLPAMLKRIRDANAVKLNLGSSGPGSTAHLAEAMFLHFADARGELIPYRGTGPALTDLMSGMIDGVIDQTVTMLPLHQDKRVKAIAVTGTARLTQSPDIPTFAEGGLPEFDLAIWNGLVAPAGTPQPVVEKLAAALSQAIDTPEFKTRLEQLAAQAPTTQERGPIAFSDLLKRDSQRVSSLVKSANLLGAN